VVGEPHLEYGIDSCLRHPVRIWIPE
jgi:hypothetical protein